MMLLQKRTSVCCPKISMTFDYPNRAIIITLKLFPAVMPAYFRPKEWLRCQWPRRSSGVYFLGFTNKYFRRPQSFSLPAKGKKHLLQRFENLQRSAPKSRCNSERLRAATNP
jgi:hypothetical protein